MSKKVRRLAANGDLFVAGHDSHDTKLGAIARSAHHLEAAPDAAFALIGYRTDEGVRRNSGRPGAALAPPEIRRHLYKLNATDARLGVRIGEGRGIVDLGDLEFGPEAFEEAKAELGHVVARCLLAGVVPIILGGGHSTSYAHFLGYVEAGRNVAIVNLDPHLDVREATQSTSGTPFREALEHSSGRLAGRYHCVGAMAHANSPAYVEYVKYRGGTIDWFEEMAAGDPAAPWRARLDAYRVRDVRVMVTLDMDSVSSAFAPGTSAASPVGFTAAQFLDAAWAAGEAPAVASLDICEVSPPLDRDGQTARLAALAIHRFLVARTRLLAQGGGAA
jgi:formiminoglutamase